MENCYVNLWRYRDAVRRPFGLAPATVHETREQAIDEIVHRDDAEYVRTIWVHDDYATLSDLSVDAAAYAYRLKLMERR